MRTNPYLLSMTIAGAALAVFGTLLVIDGYFAAQKGVLVAGSEIGAGIGLSGFGLTLLVIAWTVAAARWKPRP